MATRPLRLRSGYVSCGPVPNQRERLEARHGLEDDPDAGEIVELGRDVDGLLDRRGRRSRAGGPCARGGPDAGRGRDLVDDPRRSRLRARATSRRSRRSRPRPPTSAAAIPPIRSLSVGARQRVRAGGAARSGWDDPSLVVDDGRARAVDRGPRSPRVPSAVRSAPGAPRPRSRPVPTVDPRRFASAWSANASRDSSMVRQALQRHVAASRRARSVGGRERPTRDDVAADGDLPIDGEPRQVEDVLACA